MLQIILLTLGFFLAVSILLGLGKRYEIMKNWERYRMSPFYMATAFLYKPDDDTRSRLKFTQDNFTYAMQVICMDVLKVVLAPIFDIFQLAGGGVLGGIGGVISIKNIMDSMMQSFNKIFSIFENRWKSTLFRFSMTYRRLQTAMERLWATTASSVYLAISAIASITSTIDLIMKIIIIILVILLAIVIFLFLFMWPVIPVILSVIGLLVAAGAGSAVGGMSGTFCFAADTQVVMSDGTTKSMEDIQVGDKLGEGCGKVTARLEFQQVCEDLFDLEGIRVTGSHIVWMNGVIPVHVRDHPAARPIVASNISSPIRLFCLNTTTQRIPAVSAAAAAKPVLFSDWEELGDDDQQEWNRRVFQFLNPGMEWDSAVAMTDGETGFHPATLVVCPGCASVGGLASELVEIGKLRPGMIVLDERGEPTHVLGVVDLEAASVTAIWRKTAPRNRWEQRRVFHSGIEGPSVWKSLITESGSFQIVTGEVVRDFTDIGIQHIEGTYDWVLEALANTGMRKTGM